MELNIGGTVGRSVGILLCRETVFAKFEDRKQKDVFRRTGTTRNNMRPISNVFFEQDIQTHETIFAFSCSVRQHAVKLLRKTRMNRAIFLWNPKLTKIDS